MSSVCKTTVITVLLFSGAILSSKAQFKTSQYEVGVNAGTLVYQGDLAKSYLGNYRSLKPALGLYVSKSLSPYFSVRANLAFGKIAANDSKYSTPAWWQLRSFNFSSPVTELSGTLVFNPYGENSGRLAPYFFGGAGITFLNIKRDWSRYNQSVYDAKSEVGLGLAIDTLHSLPKILPVLPVGVGIRYALSPQLFLNAELLYRFTATDYLDGFKYAGNDKRRDNYYGLSLGISYRFGGYKCPPVKN